MNGEKHTAPWELIWEPEHVGRFWDWWGGNPALEHHYFSKRNGDSVVSQIRRFIPLRGLVVDLGAGPGYLVDRLLQRGVKTMGFDTSPKSVALMNERFEGNSNFLGAQVSAVDSIPLADASADIVILVETIEHLSDDVLDGVLSETRRITRPGGYIVVTTPNEEDLANLKVMCPNCGCVFHMYQHVRSWSAETLARRMQSCGYVKVICKPTLFSFLSSPLRHFHRLAYLALGKTLPHLLYVGRAS